MLPSGEIVGLMALGVLIACAACLRVAVQPVRRRDGAESMVVAASPASRVQAATERDHVKPRTSLPSTVATGAGHHTTDDPPFRMQMNAHAHATEFVMWMRDMGFAGRYTAAQIVDFYSGWFVRDVRVFPIPPTKFLEALNKHPGVGKKRDRLKDEHGNVPKLPSGSPMRTMFYTIAEEPAVHVPAGVRAIASPAHDSAARSRPRAEKYLPVATGKDEIVIGHERIAA